MLAVLWGCGSPAPSAPEPVPADTIDDRVARLRRDVGRAASSPDVACAAVRDAIALATDVEAALASGAPAPSDPLGLVVDGAHVRVDWNELAQAMGPGDLTTGVVTVGGIEALESAPCLAPDRLESWTRRLALLERLESCATPALLGAARASLARLRDRCTCGPVDAVTASRLATRLRPLDPDLAERYGRWADEATPCVTGRTEASPAPPAAPTP
ncbi:MAG: hypothetical protein H6736_22210 [Alphaproteobacteria bacterium]|nr:hypothetical protein [Alphaproteobacteria bacterium]